MLNDKERYEHLKKAHTDRFITIREDFHSNIKLYILGLQFKPITLELLDDIDKIIADFITKHKLKISVIVFKDKDKGHIMLCGTDLESEIIWEIINS